MPTLIPGATNSLVDVPGLRVGHARLAGPGALSGTTVVLTPPGGAVGGVDVRGAAPGTRETDLLAPHRLVERVHAVVLTGGSAYGLAAVDGVMARLETAGIGHPVGPAPGQVVPIVPAAVVFDLGRGGDFRARPGPETGAAAYDDAVSGDGAGPGGGAAAGSVGAGVGAVAGGLKGGVGGASATAAGEFTVGALVVLNAAGSAVDPVTGELHGARFGLPGEFTGLRAPARDELLAAVERVPLGVVGGPLRATTLAVIGTDAALSPAQGTLLAQMGADGLARAVRPVHTMFDGDTTFALATGQARPPTDPVALHRLLSAAADCVTRALVHAMLAAEPVTTPAGGWPTYAELFPSALGR